MKLSIKDTLKEDKPLNKGQVKSTLVYTLYRKSPLKEDNLSTKDKTPGPEGVLIEKFHCTLCMIPSSHIRYPPSWVPNSHCPILQTHLIEGRQPLYKRKQVRSVLYYLGGPPPNCFWGMKICPL